MSVRLATAPLFRSVRGVKLSGALVRATTPSYFGVQTLACGAPRLPLRWKSKKSKARVVQEADESDDDEEEDDDEEAEDDKAPGDNERIAFVSSLRVDSIMKAGIGMSKSKVIEAFYSSQIRLNGNKIPKKSTQVVRGDELDFIVGMKADNPNLMEVHRVTLLQVHNDQLTDKGRFKVRLRRQKNLTIEKYQDYEE